MSDADATQKAQGAPTALWLASYAAQVQYWSIVTNPLSIPKNWRTQHPKSPLNYTWHLRNVIRVHLLSGEMRNLMNSALGKAKSQRTRARTKQIAAAAEADKSNKKTKAISPTSGCQKALGVVKVQCSYPLDKCAGTTCTHVIICQSTGGRGSFPYFFSSSALCPTQILNNKSTNNTKRP